MKKFRPAFWPTAITAVAVGLLLGLGTWQLERMSWKRELIAAIEAGLSKAPVELPAGAFEVRDFRYRRVTVSGRFLHQAEIHLAAHNARGAFGYHVITPLLRAGGGAVLVDRGWVPPGRKAADSRARGQVEGTVEITGIVRPPWPRGRFTPENDSARNFWFYGDIEAMAAHAGVVAAPVFVEADSSANPGGWPRGGQTRLTLTDNHLKYALTWYALAAVFAVIYVLHQRDSNKSPSK